MFYSVGTGQLTNLKQKQIKQLAAQLSVEQQLYCKEITEACVCSDQARRAHSKVWLQILDCIKCYLACAPLSLKAFELTLFKTTSRMSSCCHVLHGQQTTLSSARRSSKLGTELIKAFIIPKIRTIGGRIELYLDGTGQANADRIAASHIKQLTIVFMKVTRQSPDNIDDYRQEFGITVVIF
ncbi:hypothetical protein DAPPUDRAFT_255080 [Daphnia pulex]|uniref:Uncharacterized protein n=1 Tax=Daphnia pulex TaxID=6669 RepID=E9H8H8_DAPPU|nr:hypothetical protein DAPPUDRAFT_255080 [Daphnia pulex]|eukprot:EFX71946.1 hypothetical protein DAPPUDRAFT_255080 [Daphnia pulex]